MPNETLLLVEDDPDDVFFMKRALQEAKILNPLQVVTHGDDAVAYLAGAGKYTDRGRHPLPGLVFLDLKLVCKNGFDVLKWIREQPSFANLRVIVLSSSSEERDVKKANRLGATFFLVKPPTPEMLLDLIQPITRDRATG